MFTKYPRTPHLEGSKLQPGDSGHDQVPLSSLVEGELVFEEKIDGANSGVGYLDVSIQLQSRGHLLIGGAREGQFNLFKSWTSAHEDDFYIVLGDRYTMYGEWCYAKHSVFYDNLPHYFLEFDILDKQSGDWLSTDARRELLSPISSIVHSVPVVHRGQVTKKQLVDLIGPSLYKTPKWRDNMIAQAIRHGLDPIQVQKETENSDLAEGLYIKQEKDGRVIGRFKYVRYDFVQTIIESGTHWADRPILPNMLNPSVDIFTNAY